MTKKFKIYDKVFAPSAGKGIVLLVSKTDTNNSIKVIFESGDLINYTHDGKHAASDLLPTLLHGYQHAVC